MVSFIKSAVAAVSVATVAMIGTLVESMPTFAGEKVPLGEDAWFKIGGGMRATYRATEKGSPSPTARFDDASLESLRIYLSGQLTKVVGVTLNSEIEHDGDGDPDNMRLLDGVLRLEFNDYFNIRGGLMLPPNDRANLYGPYYLGIWDFPLVYAFPTEFAGRDYGAAIWGQTGKGVFKYKFGAFRGCRGDARCNVGAGDDGDLSYTGRLTYNFWDPEPGYYTSSDYYGKKEVLAVGASATYQPDATGTHADPGNYFGYSFDVLMQKRVFGENVLTFEGAYYSYDTDNKFTPLVDGYGYFLLTSFLIDRQVGPGRFQPVVRYESLERDDLGSDATRIEGGVNYIIRGHDARVSLLVSNTDFKDSGLGSIGQFIAGVQLQY